MLWSWTSPTAVRGSRRNWPVARSSASPAATPRAHAAEPGSERAISGTALERASQAALEATGGGKVTETEAGDEESPYEVEVTRSDGSQVDVQLDRDFKLVGSEGDDDRG